jgi:hypothetical protein
MVIANNSSNGQTVFQPGATPLTAGYVPMVQGNVWSYYTKTPPFTLNHVNDMLGDFRIRWGLWMIKGPILCKSKFFIQCEDAAVKEFLVETVTRFWRSSAMRALKAVEWGYSCSEAIYKNEDGLIRFHSLKDLHSLDCKALTKNGYLVGSRVRRVPRAKNRTDNSLSIFGPKKFWHLHNREHHPYYGQSRLYGAYLPWVELWSDGGYRDSRRLFFHKFAYDGGGIYVPEGSTNVGDDGNGGPRTVSNMILGRDVVEKKKAGGTVILPGTTDDTGKRKWETIPPVVQPAPSGLMEYGETLKDEMWEGIGIPPEVGRAQGTGAYAGRIVPLISFYSILQELIYWLISDADEQLFRPLVAYNFGPGIKYEIIPFSILDEAMAEDDQTMEPSGFEDIQDQQQPPQTDPTQKGSKLSLDDLTDAHAPKLFNYLLTPVPMVF